MIKVGCCGFPVRKSIYYKEFNIAEIQKTFYDPRNLKVFKKWRDEAPSNFEFTMKAWQGVTHSIRSPTWKRYKGELIGDKDNYGSLRYTDEVLWAWEVSLKAAYALDTDKIVVQLPPSLKWDEYSIDITKTLKHMTESKMTIIVEPRHSSWFKDEVFEFFENNNIVFCTDPFKNGVIETHHQIIYLRLHGIGGYKYQYSYDELIKLKKLIKPYVDNKLVYVMFNNVYMYDDAKRFINIINE